LTDGFGIIQFARYTKPDKQSGYSLDDNARAMIVCCMQYDISRSESTLRLTQRYLNFIEYVQQKDGRFYNFVNYERDINYEDWSDDPHGRTLWALGYLISLKTIPSNLGEKAKKLFKLFVKSIKYEKI